ncbi:hypothetical protein H7Y40_02870 [Pedobacter sp.]|nr:hypothetical protein [Candidatus Saccharibacteria bacterium]
MELIKSAVRRSRLSDVVYVVLNLGFAGLVLALTILFDPPIIAYLLVVLSKWRVFAVRPRFWFANVQTNVVDLLVGLSVVTLIWLTDGTAVIQVLLAVLFAGWLLIIKPRAKRQWVLMQAGISQFLALIALFSIAYTWPSFLVVLIAWVIGYVTARHALNAYHEEEQTLLSLAWGLIVAELSWLAYHWTIAYTVVGELKVPQIAIIVTLLGFVGIKLYANYQDNKQSFKFSELRWPLIFAVAVIGMLLVRFSGLDMTQL